MANNQPVLGSYGWTVDEGAKQVWYDTQMGLVDQGGVALPGLQGLPALVSGAGDAEDLAAFIAGDNLALRYVVRDYVAPGYIF